MSDEERQKVWRELIDRFVQHRDGVGNVHLKIKSYLVSREKG